MAIPKKIFFPVAGIGVVLFLVIYGCFSPEGNIYFPKCPVYMLTGLQCPGCGSQRAIHALLQGDVGVAFRFNPLMVLSIPYLLVGLWCQTILYILPCDPRSKSAQRASAVHRKLFSGIAVYLCFGIVVLYFILRNVV